MRVDPLNDNDGELNESTVGVESIESFIEFEEERVGGHVNVMR